MLREVREEAADLAGWVLIFLDRLGSEPGGAADHLRADVLEVATLGAVADAYARRAAGSLRGGRP